MLLNVLVCEIYNRLLFLCQVLVVFILSTGKGQIHLKILEKFCHNLSIKVNYSLPLGSESDVRLYICKTGMGLEVCGTHIQDYRTDGVRVITGVTVIV